MPTSVKIISDKQCFISADSIDSYFSGNQVKEYNVLLDQFDLTYDIVDYYLQVGKPKGIQGWIIHLSAVISQVPYLIDAILPELIRIQVPFKIPLNKEIAENILFGKFGYRNLAKIVCIYPHDSQQLLKLIQFLLEKTKDFKGPLIPTDFQLGGIVFVRFGSTNPIIKIDGDGVVKKYFYTVDGKLIEDNYPVPFKLYDGLEWPFSSITAYKVIPNSDNRKSRIKVLRSIVEDFKGSVHLISYKVGLFRKIKCILKEGRYCMYSDDYGRDIQDRLRWQFELHKALENIIPIPKALDFFISNKDASLIIEYIDGEILDKKIVSIYDGRIWADLSVDKKIIIFGFLFQIIDMVFKIHHHGFVHRDITPNNFIVGESGKVYMIDLELMYSINGNMPRPPFILGTKGFMSPEQRRAEIPTTKEDIFAIGALMIVLFTCLLPTTLNSGSEIDLKNRLMVLIGNEELVCLICCCLLENSDNRPNLDTLKERLTKIYNESNFSQPIKISNGIRLKVSQSVNSAINGLKSSVLVDKNGLWYSSSPKDSFISSNSEGPYCLLTGLFNGIPSVFYTLFELRRAGFDVDNVLKDCSEANLKYLTDECFSNLDQLSNGLYYGTYGLAMMLASGVKSGYIINSEEIEKLISECFNSKVQGGNIAFGASGMGLALIYCYDYLNAEFVQQKLKEICNFLLESQESDGSWFTSEDPKGPASKYLGLSFGISGILYFLLSYINIFYDEKTDLAIVRGLDWLDNQKSEYGDAYSWTISVNSSDTDPWFANGVTGIAFTFIRAFQFYNNEKYKRIVKGALLNHPERIAYRILGQNAGLCGLGEVYLEAYSVFKEDIWRLRADWIAELLTNLYTNIDPNSCFWVMDNLNNTADLMDGNCGTIHFLARWLEPEKLSMPIFV
ncbi:lanthionine synthetase LanC family protein [Olivibacter jilunii]|uniref:lanthionine synthetase LanC family protein n=1 Tax=Olivibacter jilunii TaxID=985016 RepID=UPI00103236C2|nr:lanthionine synthetase LanC family protein [Olivibacter jilunii]